PACRYRRRSKLGILRSIESRLERVVEGSVGRLFRASVAPVELARKLAKELEEGKVVSVTQTYAPNEYTVYLSPRDRTRFAEFEASLRNELASYLAEHARRAGYVMPTRPRVRFETESSLHTGIFGISTALVRDDDSPMDVPPTPPPLETVLQTPAVPMPDPEPPVRSPLDPDPGVAGPHGGFPFPPVLEPEPAAEAEPAAEPAAEAEPEAEPAAEAEPEPAPFVPPLPDVPLPGALPIPPVPTVPVAPAVGAAGLAGLPDVPGTSDPDVPPRPPTAEPTPPPAPPLVPLEPPLDAPMITRPESREELAMVPEGRRTPIEASVVQIGRAPSCEIVLDDRNVSRRHAEIRRRGPVVVLIDLDSTNGTIVNGRRVREHPLADGDRITVGNSRLTFERRTTG
ncbi:MAG: hypothetical protein QOG49_1448, partial [Frankiaceae bacterium]|nr:hypothetical protein [Frankiaceae bacterium]